MSDTKKNTNTYFVFVFSPLGSVCLFQRVIHGSEQWDMAIYDSCDEGSKTPTQVAHELVKTQIGLNTPLNEHGVFESTLNGHHCTGHLFSLLLHDDCIILNTDIITSTQYASVEDVLDKMNQNTLTPHSLEAYQALMQTI